MNSLLATRPDGQGRGVDVWLAATETARDPEVLRRCSSVLTEDEREKCESFVHEVDRRRAWVARALLRTTLSRYAPVPPAAWRFERGAHGRPEIAGPPGVSLRFNLSHTRSLVACAVTLDADIGVDLEQVGRKADDPAVIASVCTPEEIEALETAAPEHRERRFLELWTLKEAYLKAVGVGLAGSPRSASFDLRREGRISAGFAPGARFAPETEDDPRAWWFSVQRVDDHVLALARRRRDPFVRLRILRVPSSRIVPRLPLGPTHGHAARASSLHPHHDSESTRLPR